LLLWFHPHVEFHKAPKSKHDFTLQEVHEHLENHTLLHIGGLHRSGTTLLADILAQHPSAAGLQFQEGGDARGKAKIMKKTYNEGIFLQTVYPKFGLDHDKFLLRKWIGQAAKMIFPEGTFSWMRLREGIGRFALHPRHQLDDSTRLIHPSAQEHLFNEWALFWDLSKPVLVEKSPSNIVISPFLHRLWGLGVAASPAKFLFVQRHPIPVSLATQRRAGAIVSDLSLADLVENWVAAEELRAKHVESYFEYYEPGRDVYRVVQMEDILKEPRKVLVDILRWLEMSQSEDLLLAFEEQIRPDQNLQYFKVYCNGLVRGGNKVLDEHHKMIVRFRDRVLKVSPYDLADIPKLCRQVLLGKKDQESTDAQIEDAMKAEEVAEADILTKEP